LKTVQPEDIEKIRIWRNAQIDFLRQKSHITKVDQIEYFEKNIWPELDILNPNNILLSFTLKNKMIGYGGLVHISWEFLKAESSFILNNKIDHNSEKYKIYINKFFILLKKFAFEDLKLLKISSETFKHRKRHIQLLENIGFKRLFKTKESNSIFHELYRK